jgi:hypothetical protein
MNEAMSPLARSWVRGFVEAALRPDDVDEFVHSVDEEILRAIPELAGDPGLAAELHASTREHWRNFLVGLNDDHRLALPPAAVAFTLSIARRNFDINVLLKVYRVANKAVFRLMLDRTDPATLPPGLPRDEALLALWLRAEVWIDESVEQLIDHFTRERASLAAGVHARRSETIETLLAGSVPTREEEVALGHRLTQWQTAFVLAAPANAGPIPPLFEVAVRACRLLGLPQPLTQLAGSRELWGWVATPREPDLPVDRVRGLLSEASLHLGLGRPCHGATAFRTSHRQAVAAHRVGLVSPGPCHAYADVELMCLVGDGDLAREMVRRTVGPLLGSAKDETLRQTTLAYLRAGQRFDVAAAHLMVHANTVRYRVGRVEELLGIPVADQATLLEICLGWIEMYGEAAVV